MPLYRRGATPGGSDTQIQFNDAGVLGGNSRATFNKAAGGAVSFAGADANAGNPGGNVNFTTGEGGTSSGVIASVLIRTAGTGYTALDVLTLDAGDTNATVRVDTVNGSGAILTYTLTAGGTGYITSLGGYLDVTGGTGTGAQFFGFGNSYSGDVVFNLGSHISGERLALVSFRTADRASDYARGYLLQEFDGSLGLFAGGDGYYASLNASDGYTENSTGGSAYVYGGNGSNYLAGGGGGSIDVGAGSALGTGNNFGGNVNIFGGDGINAGYGGDVIIDGGSAGATGNGGDIVITSGAAVGGSNISGSIFLNIASTGGYYGNVWVERAIVVLSTPLDANTPYSGIVERGTAGATLAFGDLVYFSPADSRWELADADAASTAGDVRLGICVQAAAVDGSATIILSYGKVYAPTAFPTFTVGSPEYVSTTAGDVQEAQPSGVDDVIRRVGFAFDADTLFFNPSNDYITHT